MSRRTVYGLLLLVAASLICARILTVPGAFSANDQSRWATIRALVENGSYSIGSREYLANGSYRDLGIIAQPEWETADVVLHPETGRFYSSKPTLLPTLLAGEYWFIRNLLNLNLRRDRLAVSRIILFTINLLPFVIYLLLLSRIADRLGTTDWARLFVFATAAFGTFVSGFLGSLNNHTVAAAGALFAVYHCLSIHLDEDRRPARFLLAGLFAGWTVCNELPAAGLVLGLMLWLLWLSPRDTLRYALPALALPVGVYLFTQYLAVGSIVPTYAREQWYRFEGSYWGNPVGVDRADEHVLLYAFHLLVGHTGILSLTPMFVAGWIGMVRSALHEDGNVGRVASARRVLGCLTLALTVITFVFYVVRTHNYGGITAGARWFIWLMPLWLLTMLPELDRWAADGRRRAVAAVLLAFSIGTANHALVNPWQPSWLFNWFTELGLIVYS
ncbi:MAG: hypothetical protein H0U94_06045 [Acidobacteria bacterium]|nr:hypothetical protein [Acidobacteriota bacterium]